MNKIIADSQFMSTETILQLVVISSVLQNFQSTIFGLIQILYLSKRWKINSNSKRKEVPT